MAVKTFQALPFESVLGNLKTNWGWVLVFGVALSLLGVLALAMPGITSMSLSVMIGLLMLASGIFNLIESVKVSGAGHRVGYFVISLLSMAGAAILILFPGVGAFALSLMIGFYLLGIGGTRISMALVHRPQTGWGWVFTSGVISLLLGAWMVVTIPATGFVLPGIFFGIELMVAGLTSIAVAFSVPSM